MSQPTRSALARREASGRPDTEPSSREALRKVLLFCGILSSLLYVAMNVYVPMQWEGYNIASQAVSELSAIDAPTRTLWVQLVIPYTILAIAFGCGVWMSAGGSRALRVVGGVFIADGVIGPFWPPMHLRGAETTMTDTLHIVFTMMWLVLMLLGIGFAAASLGRRFRLYSIVTVVTFLVFGALTAMDGPRIAANLPTPWLGVWERINIGALMLWISALAVAVWRAPVDRARTAR